MCNLYDKVKRIVEANSVEEAENLLYGKEGIQINNTEYYQTIIANFVKKKDLILPKINGNIIYDLDNDISDIWSIVFISNFVQEQWNEVKAKINKRKESLIEKINCETDSERKKQLITIKENLLKEVNEINVFFQDIYKQRELNKIIISFGKELNNDQLELPLLELKKAIRIIQKLRDSFEHKNDKFYIGDIIHIDNEKNKFRVDIPSNYLDGFNKGRIITNEKDKKLNIKIENTISPILEEMGYDIHKINSFFYNVEPNHLSYLLDICGNDIKKLYQLPYYVFDQNSQLLIKFILNNEQILSCFHIKLLNSLKRYFSKRVSKYEILNIIKFLKFIKKEFSNFDVDMIIELKNVNPYRIDEIIDLVNYVKCNFSYFDDDMIIDLINKDFYNLDDAIRLLEFVKYVKTINQNNLSKECVKLLLKNKFMFHVKNQDYDSINRLLNYIKGEKEGLDIQDIELISNLNYSAINNVNLTMEVIEEVLQNKVKLSINDIELLSSIHFDAIDDIDNFKQILKCFKGNKNDFSNFDVQIFKNSDLITISNTYRSYKKVKKFLDYFDYNNSELMQIDIDIMSKINLGNFEKTIRLFNFIKGSKDMLSLEDKHNILKINIKDSDCFLKNIKLIYGEKEQLKMTDFELLNKIKSYIPAKIVNYLKNDDGEFSELSFDLLSKLPIVSCIGDFAINRTIEIIEYLKGDNNEINKDIIDIFSILNRRIFIKNDEVDFKRYIDIIKFYQSKGVPVESLSEISSFFDNWLYFQIDEKDNEKKEFAKYITNNYGVNLFLKFIEAERTNEHIFLLRDFKLENLIILLNIVENDIERLLEFPIEFFLCDKDILLNLLQKYNSNLSKSIFGITDPKVIASLIYANSVLSNIDRNTNFENVSFDPIMFIHNLYNDSVRYVRNIDEDISFGQEEYLKQFIIDEKTGEQRSINDIKKYIINKLRNSVAHFRFKLIKDQNNNIIENKIYLYDEYNNGVNNFNIVINLNDLVEVVRKVEIGLNIINSKIQHDSTIRR